MLVRGFPGLSGTSPERFFRVCEAVAFELYGFPSGILADENKIAIVCDQNLTIFSPITADLFAVGGYPGVV